MRWTGPEAVVTCLYVCSSSESVFRANRGCRLFKRMLVTTSSHGD
jgi:hypothetical protein